MSLYSNTSGLIEGVHRELVVGQFERLDEINNRIASRHFPDQALEPNFSFRPVSTKYSLLPIAAKNSNPEPKIAIEHRNEHNVATNFNPATKHTRETSIPKPSCETKPWLIKMHRKVSMFRAATAISTTIKKRLFRDPLPNLINNFL